MKHLLGHIKSIKEERLSEFKVALELQENEVLAELETEYAQLQAEIHRVKKTMHEQVASKEAFQLQMATNFATEEYKQELLGMLWQEVSNSFFQKKEAQDALLSKLIATLPDRAGIVRAGASYSQLQNLLKDSSTASKSADKSSDKKSLKLRKDPNLDSEMGFIFESEDVTVDARLSSVLQTLFQNKRSALYKVAFEY